ncbi:MAG TPA: hypothetical protein VLL48_07755, partial [Longimicrobiales bacterium]|nr:hypothetical protein [Longimicrobiales bacterium]
SGDTVPIAIADAPDVNEHSPTLSPDGRWLAYVSDESGRWELYVRPFPNVDDGRWPVSSQGGTEPRWAPDGGELFYKSADGELVATRVSAGAEGAFVVAGSEVLFPVDAYYGYAFQPQWDVHPDGERFLMLRLPEADEARLVLVQNWDTELLERMGGS